jgi:nitrogen fixation protein FixH
VGEILIYKILTLILFPQLSITPDLENTIFNWLVGYPGKTLKITMKKTFLKLAACAMIVLAIASCKGGGGNDPKSVAKNFFEAFKTMNIDEAAKYATKDSKSMLDMMKMGMSMAPKNLDSLKSEMDKHKIEYGEPVINGDEATITVTTDGKEKTDFKLKKEDGQWKVAFDKNSLMKTGMEKMQEKGASDEQMEEAQKALQELNSDTLKDALQGAGKALQEAGKTLDSLGGGKQ